MRGEIQGIAETEAWTSGKREKAFEVGDKILIRTVTMYQLGQFLAACDGFMVIGDASWVANTGAFSTALETGKLEEVEPVHGVIRINIDAIVDVFEWRHPLFKPGAGTVKGNRAGK